MKDCGGLILDEYPGTQMVVSIVAGVTTGLSAPGVHVGSGSTQTPEPPSVQLRGTTLR